MRILRRFTNIPQFGVLFSTVIFLVVVPAALMCFVYVYKWYPHSVGFNVTINRPQAAAVGEQPLTITIQCIANEQYICASEQLYLNRAPVSPLSLPQLLRSELSRRSERVVYVEGDNNLPYSDVLPMFCRW